MNMANISLYSGKVNTMPDLLWYAKSVVKALGDELNRFIMLCRLVESTVCNLDDIIQTVTSVMQEQDRKFLSLEQLYLVLLHYTNSSARIDIAVYELINLWKSDFYDSYSYLRPLFEKAIWSAMCDRCTQVKQWCQENWKSLLTSGIMFSGASRTRAMAYGMGFGFHALREGESFQDGMMLGFVKSLYDTKNFATNLISDIEIYDRMNEDPRVVERFHYFTSYKGTLVVNIPFNFPPFNAGFSFGFIGLPEGTHTEEYLKHEYGHRVQLDNLGLSRYVLEVFLPSAIANVLVERKKVLSSLSYYGSPWEHEADVLGGVNRTGDNEPWPEEICRIYWNIRKYLDTVEKIKNPLLW